MDVMFTNDDHAWLRKTQREQESSGEERQRREVHIAHQKERADENDAKTKEKEQRKTDRAARDDEAMKSAAMIVDPSAFSMSMLVAEMNVQGLHYLAWDPSSLPSKKKDYKNKPEKLRALVDASKLYQTRGGTKEGSLPHSDESSNVPDDEVDDDDMEMREPIPQAL